VCGHESCLIHRCELTYAFFQGLCKSVAGVNVCVCMCVCERVCVSVGVCLRVHVCAHVYVWAGG